MTKIITRFAPSPTGYLHIGGARCALFNYLLAKNAADDGKFLLRIEDTDSKRNVDGAVQQIINSLNWLGIKFDGDAIFQSQRADLYKDAVDQLIKTGKAYYCFLSEDELGRLKQEARDKKIALRSPWRDKDKPEIDIKLKESIKPVVRLKVPNSGQIALEDIVQGRITTDNVQIDDMILARSDGSATYMLSCVYDDHDMGITHIIRGDDHLTNAMRQIAIYQAFGWNIPAMAHVPLINDERGEKLSKRRGALGIDEYAKCGFLPEAMFNYMLRLGWSHGDDEIINAAQAAQWFNAGSFGKSPARLDEDKMLHLNAHYIKSKSDQELANLISEHLKSEGISVSDKEAARICKGMEGLKKRANLINDLAHTAKIYLDGAPKSYSDQALKSIKEADNDLIKSAIDAIAGLDEGASKEDLHGFFKDFAARKNAKLKTLMSPIRALITAQDGGPGAFEIISIIGIKDTLRRLQKIDEIK